jgi:hypothetical protein
VHQESYRERLGLQPGFRWLDETSGWFWFSNPYRNPLVNRVMKLLSVANPVRASALRVGILRDRRMRGVSVPGNVLLHLCRQVPGLHVRGDAVRAERKLEPEDVLDEIERTIAYILLENDGIMKRSRLQSICFASGMKRATFFHNLLYSPIISKYARGIYGLADHTNENTQSGCFEPEYDG